MTEGPLGEGTRSLCTGTGDKGDHCCYIMGVVCPLLIVPEVGRPICSLWNGQMIGNPEWDNAPVGQWMAENHPGYDCRDWPQNIPTVMARKRGLCCYQSYVSEG